MFFRTKYPRTFNFDKLAKASKRKPMSKFILEKNIRTEIMKLNEVIDLKIIRGLPYRREAMRHRFLLFRLADMHRLPRFHSNWFERTVNVVATFLL